MLRAAATTFELTPRVGDPTSGHTGAVLQRVVGPLKSTLLLLENGPMRVCLLASHFGTSIDDTSYTLQNVLADELALPLPGVMVASSHNHCVPLLDHHSITGWEDPRKLDREPDLTPLGNKFVREMRKAARSLPARLEPVSVWWGLGREGRITYNRKGRRADGSTYLMREEDRQLVGKDYRGDIDEEAPVVVLRSERDLGRPLAILVQFTGHPVTAYHPEKPVSFGDYAQAACDVLSKSAGGAPVAFLQGCAGDMNSKHMFSGDTKLAARYGRWLGSAYIKAYRSLKRSTRDGMGYKVRTAEVPFAALPSERALRRELAEMKVFVARAKAGSEDTLTCVGLNFARAMSPAYRGRLIELVIPWNEWALRMRASGRHRKLPRALPLDVHALRLGDVGIVTMPTEPFLGVGRQIRDRSPLPLTIPCGYVNQATGFVGYIPDSPNTGDREYQSAFYRYTRYCPPFRKPAGDVLARVGVAMLRELA